MQKLFKPTSYQLKNKKWVPQYCIIIRSGPTTSTQPITINNKYYDTREDADQFVINICINKGYLLAKSK